MLQGWVKMKKVLFSFLILLFVSGCFNYKELNDYTIATSLAIDYQNHNYITSLLVSNTSSDDKEKSIVYSGKGKTIYEAIKSMDLILTKEIYLGHLSSVVISENVAKRGINDTLEYLLTEPQSNKDFYIVLAKNTKAKDILKTTTPLPDFSSKYIAQNIKTTDNLQGSVVAVDYNTLLKQIVNKENPVLNGFTIKNKILKLDTLGYFKGDKLIGWANLDESKGINIINNNIDEMYLQVKCSNKYMIININNLTSTIKIKKDKMATISIDGEAYIKDNSCLNDINTKSLVHRIIDNYMNKAIALNNKHNLDLFNIKKLYYQEYGHKISDYQIRTKINIKINNHNSHNIERIIHEKNN